MKSIKYILIILIFNTNISYCNLLQDDSGYGFYPLPENDHIIFGLNYNYNFNTNNRLIAQFEGNINNVNYINAEFEVFYISFKSIIFINIGYEYFGQYSKKKYHNFEKEYKFKAINDFILIKLSIFDIIPTLSPKRIYFNLQSEIGIGYKPYSEFTFQTEDDFNILKENNIIDKRKSYYPINYKIGAEINIGYIPKLLLFGNNIYFNSAYKLEYYHQPILTKNWNFRIELGLKYSIDLGD